MKRNYEEIVIIIVQILMFYLFPLFVHRNHNNGIIVIILLATFMLAVGLGGISKKRIKYYYPIFITILFMPSLQIYDIELTVLDGLWCLLASTLGIITGDLIMNRK